MKRQFLIGLVLVLVVAGCTPLAGPVGTVDPFLAVESAERTAQAARDQAEFYSRQLTATAEAPMVEMTRTAAAFAMEQEYAQATAQSVQATQMAASTLTAQSWTPTPNLTATMALIELSATAQVMANNVEKDNLSVERARRTNGILAGAPYVVGILIALFVALVVIAFARRLSVMPVPVDARGNPQPMFDVVEGVAFDADRMTNGALGTRRRDIIKLLPPITAERQDIVTHHDQLVDLKTRSAALQRLEANLRKQLPAPEMSQPQISVQEDNPRLLLPDWRLLNKWDGHLLPYGVDGNQKLLTVDPAKRPHLMITGTTGTGKTRYEIRTIVAGALTSGWQVIVVGKQADYIPFEEHPNVTMIPANAVKEPEKYVRVLKAASEQIFTRDEFLVSQKLSTWDRYGGAQTLIVVDDYSAAMMMMPSGSAKEVLKWALAIAMDGRKYGLNLLLGLQRATWTCISTDLRSQMGRIALRVESARDSRVVLDEEGAESLFERHFLARLEDGAGLIRGVAFAMSDAETFAFLASRPVQPVEKPKWIESVIRSPVELPQAQTVNALPSESADGTKTKIIAEYLKYVEHGEMQNYRAIQRAVWGDNDTPGGAHFSQVKQVIADFEGISVDELATLSAKRVTTNGDTAGNLPDSGPLAV